MVIKLRKFSRNIFLKVVTFLLIAASLAFCVAAFFWAGFQLVYPEHVLTDIYSESFEYQMDVNNATNYIVYEEDYYSNRQFESLLYWIKDKDGNIRSNATINDIKALNTTVYRWDGINTYADDELMSNRYYHTDGASLQGYSAYTPDYLFAQQEGWGRSHAIAMTALCSIAIGLLVAIILSVYLVLVAGRKPDDQEVQYNVVDRIFTDIQIGLLIPLVLLTGWGVQEIYVSGYNSQLANERSFVLRAAFVGVVALAGLIPIGAILLSFVRKIKGKRFFKHSLIYWVLSRFVRIFKSLFDGRAFKNFPLTKALFWRQTIFISCSIFNAAVMVILALSTYYGNYGAFMVFGFFILLFEAILIYWYLTASLKSYSDINKGMSDSIDEQMKSERMKVTLITNVSHDLKTPLTSIISYVDLLSKEELTPVAKDYVTILAQKSDRLKHIVSDLFELSKVTSGSITVDLERLDLKKLLEQTLADMEDAITESGLDFRQNLTAYPVYIMGDGKKLYRVLQNIITNTLKYSLAGTRVFVNLESDMAKVTIAVKNTSANEMSFTADEIMQRFYRGDQARSTEGNGLGLSIAQGFTHACGGDFAVDIDGDLFKVTLSFKVDIAN